ncbi:MAG: hypothetical protein AAF495_22580 [Pseudomonadota bacterium]
MSAIDPAFAARLAAGEGFSHRDHIAVATELLAAHDFLEAAQRYSAGIRAIAAEAGQPEKFNTTITLAFLSLIAEHMASGPYEDAEDFIDRNPELLARGLLEAWYPAERLASPLARELFLMPAAAQGSGSLARRPPSTV